MPAPSARTLVRLLVDKNPLFLLSALLLLGGAWLTNQPEPDGGRDMDRLLRLFATVQGYEVALLGAAFALTRRGGLERDVRGLGLLLVPFLLDVSCTNAVVAEHTPTWGSNLALAVGLVALAALKGWGATRLAGVRFDGRAWAALLLAPAFACVAPLAASFARHHGVDAGSVGLGLGLGVAALLSAVAGAAREGAGPVRAVGAIAATVATFHALATTYGQTGHSLHVIGPVLLALGPALPRLLGAPAAGLLATWSPLVLPVAGAIACGIPGLGSSEASILGMSSWRAGLLAAGAIHALLLARRGGLAPLLGVSLAFHLGVSGSSMSASFGSLGHAGLAEPIALLGMFAFGVARRAHLGLLAPPLVLASLLLSQQAMPERGLDIATGLATLGAGLLAWTHRTHGGEVAGAGWRVLGAGLVWLPFNAVALGRAGDLAPVLAQVSLVLLLGLGVLTRTRSHALPSALLLLEGAREITPTTSSGWGGVGLGLAFGVVGLGVAVSLQRERLLAWLDQAPATDDPPRSFDWAAGARRSAQAAAALLVVGVASGAATKSTGYSHHHYPLTAAIGSLKAIATAQVIFSQGDKDADGVADFGSLHELGEAQLIDAVLASGEKSRYRFRIAMWEEADGRRRWQAVATPTEQRDLEGGRRQWLRMNDDGQLEKSETPLELESP